MTFPMRYFTSKESRRITNTEFCNERAFSGSTFGHCAKLFLFCFIRAEEFEPSRRAENSVLGFAPVVVSIAAGRTRRAAAQLN